MAGKKKSKAPAKPVFNEAALSKLTETIEDKLETEASVPRPKKQKQKQKQKQKDDRPAKRKRDNEDASKDEAPKKRQAKEPNHTPKHGSAKPKKGPKDTKPDLLEEIKLLGGDEADLDLVAGIDSDAEEGQAPKPGKVASTDLDKALKKELAKFAAGLGFEKVRDDDVVTDDEAGEETVQEGKAEEEWQDEPANGREEDAEEEEEEEDEASPAEKSQGRSAAGKLVSPRLLPY